MLGEDYPRLRPSINYYSITMSVVANKWGGINGGGLCLLIQTNGSGLRRLRYREPRPARADGVSRPGAIGGFDRGYGQARPHHQGGQPSARRILVECSWSYQHPPRVGKEKQERVAAAPPAVREIAWKAQCRLSARYRALIRKGKLKTVAVTAVARELSAFIWAINRQIANPSAAAR